MIMYKLFIKTITPLHIAGQEQMILNLDYVMSDGKVGILNRLQTAKHLAENKVFDFNKNYTYTQVSDAIKNQADSFPESVYSRKLTVSDEFAKYLKSPGRDGQMLIGDFISNGRSYYIPASSVKGALLTPLGLSQLGIDVKNPLIKERFVIADSEPLSASNFKVLRTMNRPPSVNIVCIKPNLEFDLMIKRIGTLDIANVVTKCNDYSKNQIDLALDNLPLYKGKNKFGSPKGANLFEDALLTASNYKPQPGEFLLNIGFGGGSWFKVEQGIVPKFKSKSPSDKRRGKDEPAHTSVEFDISGNMTHIGWCVCRFEEVN
jgi:hypothetical protein